jgi:hypothetical protein
VVTAGVTVLVGVIVLVGVTVGVVVLVGVTVGVTVLVGVGVGVGYDAVITFEIVGPPTEQICVTLKYTVPVVILIDCVLGDVQPPALLLQVKPSDDHSTNIVPQDGALVNE